MLTQNPVMENSVNAGMVLKEVSNVDQEELRISTAPAVSIGVVHNGMSIEVDYSFLAISIIGLALLTQHHL